MAAHADLLLDAKDGFVKFKIQVLAKIGSALGAAATASALSKQVAEPEHVSKYVAEILEDRGIESRQRRQSLPPTPACPKRSYKDRFSLSARMAYASVISLNFSSASGLFGLRSGWYVIASLR